MAAPATKAEPKAAAATLGDLYEAHAPFAWRCLRRLGVRDADVEDAVQETFVVVQRKLSGYDARAAFRTWLFGICQRVASDFRRRAHVRREVATEAPLDEPVGPTQPAAVEAVQARAVLERILGGLDEPQRVAFVLYELEQWPMAEVALAAGCPLQTAYSRVQTARRRVLEAIEEERRREAR